MVLSAHAIAGASLGTLMPHPLPALAVGFASHFLLDAVPHQDYSIRSLIPWPGDPKKPFFSLAVFGDLAKVGFDCLAGFAIASLLFAGRDGGESLALALSGALGGVLPDALQLAHYKIGGKALAAYKRFHKRFEGDLVDRPIFGRVTQIATVAAIVVLSLLIA